MHRRLGLDRAAHPVHGGLYSGASPLALHTFQYFLSLDLPILELLGSSETCGPQDGDIQQRMMFILFKYIDGDDIDDGDVDIDDDVDDNLMLNTTLPGCLHPWTRHPPR